MSEPIQYYDVEDEEKEVSPEAIIGCIGIMMLILSPVVAIVDNVAGILAFLAACVLWGLAEHISRSEGE